MKYADVIIHINSSALQRPFTYLIPDELRSDLKIGSVVNVPFGRGESLKKGYVIGLSDSLSFDISKIKNIESISYDISFDKEMLELAYFIEKRYFTTINKALNCMLPAKIDSKHKKEKYLKLIKDENFIREYISENKDKKTFKKRIEVLEYLINNGCTKLAKVLDEVSASRSVFSTLERSRLIDISEDITWRVPYDSSKINKTDFLEPNDEQNLSITKVSRAIAASESKIFLLHGVTGSGKTEVYLHLIEKVIASGKSAIFLIPEISLTHQTVKSAMARFGDLVGVIHSRLSAGEKYDQWKLAKEGRLKLIIGPRSAIFTPFLNIGIIIIDEEHESTYKSDREPRYNAKEIAIKRANYHKCPVLLGSATPSVETYYKASTGIYDLLELKSKAMNENIISTEIVDMRRELQNSNKSIFSDSLKLAIENCLEKKEQIILFLNARAYARTFSCRECGFVAKCGHCDVAYHYHKKDSVLRCHYCDSEKPVFKTCPKCGSKRVKDFGIGTEKVEYLLNKAFPEAKVLRMDVDTTSGKFGHDDILSSFDRREADILLGTQMVVKGHHFANVTLVGVLLADLSLYTSDFYSAERTFQLITQVLGRSGRADIAGKGIIQTYSPKHYSIEMAAVEDYMSFYKTEIAFRKIADYPPFTNILVFYLSSKDETYLLGLSERLVKALDNRDDRITVLGPTKPAREKIADNYRRLISVKSINYNLLLSVIKYIRELLIKEDYEKKITLSVDINPTYM